MPRVLELAERAVGSAIATRLEMEEGPLLLRTDRVRFESALLNLAVNARDAMPGGGSLTISARGDRPGDAGAGGRFVEIVVSDTGCGMSGDVVERIFEPFFTTKEVGKGTGLGLGMVFNYVSAANGTVFVESEPGLGATFRILLPQSEESPECASARDDAPPKRDMGRGQQALVVEDDESLRKFVREALETLGFEVSETASADMGLKESAALANYDLIVADVRMAGRYSGLDLAREARALRADARLLPMTGCSQEKLADSGIPFILMPFGVEELHRRIAALG